MKTLQADSKNDLVLNPSRSLYYASGLDAVMAVCENVAKTMFGEMVFAQDEGQNNFTTVWARGQGGLAAWKANLRASLLKVDGVTGVSELTASIGAGVLSYSATIETIYGTGVIGG